MASTNAASGSLTISAAVQTAFAGDSGGARSVSFSVSKVLAAVQALPTIGITGWLHGYPVCAAGDWLMAHASDPFGTMGDATYSDGFAPASKAFKGLIVYNMDAANDITVIRKTTNGLPVFNAVTAGVVLKPGGFFVWLDPAGAVIPTLTTGTNDALTIAVSAGSPQAEVIALYA